MLCQPVELLRNRLARLRIEGQVAAQFSQTLGHRMIEDPCRQQRFDRFAAAALPGCIPCLEGDAYLYAGPGMGTEILEAAALGLLRLPRGQGQGQLHALSFPGGIAAGNDRHQAFDSIVIPHSIVELQGATQGACGCSEILGLGREVWQYLEIPAAENFTALPYAEAAALFQRSEERRVGTERRSAWRRVSGR